ncbi:MAG: hypothetical protein DRI90_17215 [Deltaproteobacteria bacterium]|nr:MAG: hypothetical protein DRI90_17215 [Deltaproteobacteria bacterium]
MSKKTGSTTGGSAPADLARRIIEHLNARDLAAVEALWTEDIVEDFVAVGPFRGKPAARGFFEELFEAFPDFYLTIERVMGDDQTAVVQWRATGTFTGGPFQGVGANGKPVELRGVDCMKFEGGLMHHNTVYYDGAAFARTVGLLPAQGSGPERALFGAFNAVTAIRKRLGG